MRACMRAARRPAGTAPVVQHQGNVEQQVEDIALAVPEVPAPTAATWTGELEAKHNTVRRLASPLGPRAMHQAQY